jgi:hypothetical protein
MQGLMLSDPALMSNLFFFAEFLGDLALAEATGATGQAPCSASLVLGCD